LLKKVIVIILVLIAIGASIGAIFMAYEYKNAAGDHQILLLIVHPNDSQPGTGSVDTAYILPMVNYNAVIMNPVYPFGMYNPNTSAPAEVQQQLLLQNMGNNAEQDANQAQRTVEQYTGIKTDAVVIMTPAAINAIVDAVGPIYVDGIGYMNSDNVNSLLYESNLSQTRDYNVYSVMRALMESYHNPLQRPALLLAVANQYYQGNIIVIPKQLLIQFAIASGTNKLQ
jgi:Protein of unknown function (DUF4012)